MKSNIYLGPFKEYLQSYIELKRAIGYKYDTEAEHLKRFDKFTLQKYPNVKALTKDIVLDWCSKKPYEAQANQLSRASIIRQFGKYLDSIGIKAYIIPKRYFPSETKYIPYIFSIEELTRFFAETDRCQYCYECPYRHLIMPIIFRMIYTCGLRLSEARLLKVADVDLKNGSLTIHHSKKDKSRLVPMSKSLTRRCRTFSKKVHFKSIGEFYYFPGHQDKPMTIGNVYHNFRRFLMRAKISHGGKGCGPRIYDFRHTYAVHCLKKWTQQEKDLTAYLPILKTYMGHDSFTETAYYLHLTIDMFPDITGKLELRYPGIIPELEGGIDETY
jgi:integrase/recombinase XerD